MCRAGSGGGVISVTRLAIRADFLTGCRAVSGRVIFGAASSGCRGSRGMRRRGLRTSRCGCSGSWAGRGRGLSVLANFRLTYSIVSFGRSSSRSRFAVCFIVASPPVIGLNRPIICLTVCNGVSASASG